MIQTILFLIISNVFMTYAWYGHLKDLGPKPLWIAILVSWSVALLEYCFQVPANRIGFRYFSLVQLKILQEVITLIVFSGFAYFYMGARLTSNIVLSGICLAGAVYFAFKDVPHPG